MFKPEDHIKKIQGNDYLEAKYRIQWFRDVMPQGRIDTTLLLTEPSIVFKAAIFDNEGKLLATGHGSAPLAGSGKWAGREIEKAETAAISRALGMSGFGTQFTGNDFDDSEYLSDAPVANTSDEVVWKKAVKDGTHFLYVDTDTGEYNEHFHKNSLKKRMADTTTLGINMDTQTPEQAIITVIAYRAVTDLDIGVQEFPAACEGKSLTEYVRDKGATHAWARLLSYASVSKKATTKEGVAS